MMFKRPELVRKPLILVCNLLPKLLEAILTSTTLMFVINSREKPDHYCKVIFLYKYK